MIKPADSNDTTSSSEMSLAAESPVVNDFTQARSSILARVIAKHAQKRLEIEGGSTNDFARILMANGQSPAYTPSHWEVTRLQNFPRFVTIRNLNSGKYLTVPQASQASGVNLVQFAFSNGARNQQFFLEDVGDGYFSLWARHSQLYIEVFGGLSDGHPPLVQSATRQNELTHDHQRFRFDAI